MDNLAIEVRRQLVNNIVKNMGAHEVRNFNVQTIEVIDALADYIVSGKKPIKKTSSSDTCGEMPKHNAEAETKKCTSKGNFDSTSTSSQESQNKQHKTEKRETEINPLMDLFDAISNRTGITFLDENGQKMDFSKLAQLFGK